MCLHVSISRMAVATLAVDSGRIFGGPGHWTVLYFMENAREIDKSRTRIGERHLDTFANISQWTTFLSSECFPTTATIIGSAKELRKPFSAVVQDMGGTLNPKPATVNHKP